MNSLMLLIKKEFYMKKWLLSSISLLVVFAMGCVVMYPDYNNNGVLDTNETLYPTKNFANMMNYYVDGDGNPSYEKYGETVLLNNIDTRYITDMSFGFMGMQSFNLDISHWNTSSVLYMERLFSGALSFDQAIDVWDVSSVTNMDMMFQFAKSFNQDVSVWDVSNVASMDQMFIGASSFNQDLSAWADKIGNVRNMHAMFSKAASLNQDFSSWDITGIPSQKMFDDTPMQDKLEWHPFGCGCLRH